MHLLEVAIDMDNNHEESKEINVYNQKKPLTIVILFYSLRGAMYVYYYFIYALYEWAAVQIILVCFALEVLI